VGVGELSLLQTLDRLLAVAEERGVVRLFPVVGERGEVRTRLSVNLGDMAPSVSCMIFDMV
jgi:hypothetical protein